MMCWWLGRRVAPALAFVLGLLGVGCGESASMDVEGSLDLLQANGPALVVAGGSQGDGLHRLDAKMHPIAIALDEAAGRLYYSSGHQVMAIDLHTDRVIRIAGTGVGGTSGTGGPAVLAQLRSPNGIDVAPDGSLLIAEAANDRVLRVHTNGVLTVVGTGLERVFDVEVAPNGDVFALNSDALFRIRPARIDTIYNAFTNAQSISSDAAGNIYVAETGSYNIWRFAPNGGRSIVASGSDALGTPRFVNASANGELYIGSTSANVIRHLDTQGNLVVIAGVQFPLRDVIYPDVGLATQAMINASGDIESDSAGRVYFAEPNNDRIRRVDEHGMIDTFGGLGTGNFFGEGVPATDALLSGPQALALHPHSGDIYVADTLNSVIRRVDMSGTIHTEVGIPEAAGFNGDDGPARETQLRAPASIAINSAGVLYIADTGNARVRKLENGRLTTVLGHAGGSALGVGQRPVAVAIDRSDNVYVAYTGAHTVVRIAVDGSVSRFAGTGQSGFSDAERIAISARLNTPIALATAPDGSVYIADTGNRRIRRVANGVIETVVGNGIRGNGEDGVAGTATPLSTVTSLSVDSVGALYFGDSANQNVRRLKEGVVQTVFDAQAVDSLVVRGTHQLYFTADDRVFVLEVGPSGPGCLLDVDGDGQATANEDGVYIFRGLNNLQTIVPAPFRALDPTIPSDEVVREAIERVRPNLDIDGDGHVRSSTDGVYIFRGLNRLMLIVPSSFRGLDPTIPSDASIRSRIEALCPG